MDYFALPSRAPSGLFSLAVRVLKSFDSFGAKLTGQRPNPRWVWPDWFSTPHNTDFFLEEDFQRAYLKAIEVAGFDYRIPWRVHQALWSVSSTSNLDGDIVEVGTGRGFIMAAVAEWCVEHMGKNPKKIWLFDKFELPSSGDVKKQIFRDYYSPSPQPVMEKFSAWPFVHFVVGDVYQTIPTKAPRKISFLHLDLNDSAAEPWVLEKLWPNLVPGAIILLDDYANRGLEDQYKAINGFLAKRGGATALTTAAGQGIVIK